MKKLCISVLLAVLVMSFAGCAVFQPYETGTRIDQTQMDRLVDKKSTKADVIAVVGHPTRKEAVGKRELWYYPYQQIKHFGANTDETTVFEFNAKGVLQEHYKSNGGGSNALTDAANKK